MIPVWERSCSRQKHLSVALPDFFSLSKSEFSKQLAEPSNVKLPIFDVLTTAIDIIKYFEDDL